MSQGEEGPVSLVSLRKREGETGKKGDGGSLLRPFQVHVEPMFASPASMRVPITREEAELGGEEDGVEGGRALEQRALEFSYGLEAGGSDGGSEDVEVEVIRLRRRVQHLEEELAEERRAQRLQEEDALRKANERIKITEEARKRAEEERDEAIAKVGSLTRALQEQRRSVHESIAEDHRSEGVGVEGGSEFSSPPPKSTTPLKSPLPSTPSRKSALEMERVKAKVLHTSSTPTPTPSTPFSSPPSSLIASLLDSLDPQSAAYLIDAPSTTPLPQEQNPSSSSSSSSSHPPPTPPSSFAARYALYARQLAESESTKLASSSSSWPPPRSPPIPPSKPIEEEVEDGGEEEVEKEEGKEKDGREESEGKKVVPKPPKERRKPPPPSLPPPNKKKEVGK